MVFIFISLQQGWLIIRLIRQDYYFREPMDHYFTRSSFLIWWQLVFVILPGSFIHGQNPAVLSGTVTNAANANPIIGALISVSGQTAYSVYNGAYTLTITLPGTYIVTCTKAGFDNFTSTPVTFQPGVTTTLNIQLNENTNAPVSLTAVLNPAMTSVNLYPGRSPPAFMKFSMTTAYRTILLSGPRKGI